jgi:hypothetical protein
VLRIRLCWHDREAWNRIRGNCRFAAKMHPDGRLGDRGPILRNFELNQDLIGAIYLSG